MEISNQVINAVLIAPFIILPGMVVIWFLKTMIGGAMEFERSIQTSMTNFSNRPSVLPPTNLNNPMPAGVQPSAAPTQEIDEKKKEPVRHLPDSSTRILDLAD